MASQINASNSGFGGIVSTGDSSGELQLQTAGTTALTIDTSQRAAFVAGTAALPAITTTGDTNTGIFFPAADTIAFAEGGTESMRIDSSGNVGIGTASPISGRALTLNNASNYYGIRFQVGGTSIAQLIQETTGFFYIDSNMNNESGGTIFRTGATERMRIDSSGRITAPYQTTFSVFNLNFPSGTAGVGTGGTVLVNIGSCYNSSNGRFTAPVTGTYVFGLSVQAFASGSTTYIDTVLLVNGSQVGSTFVSGYGGVHNNHMQITGTVTATLNANDYAQIGVDYGARSGTQNIFTGFLIG